MDAAAALENGLAMHRAGRLSDAAAAYRQVIGIDANNFEGVHLLGLVEFQQGRHADALVHLRRAIEINPAAAPAHNNYGIVLNLMGDHGAAVASFDRAIVLAPDYAAAHLNRGRALGELGRVKDAIASFERAIALTPQHCEPYNDLGKALASAQSTEQAVAMFDRAIALAPDYAEAHANRALALVSLGRDQEAIASLERALALRPNDPRIHMIRANVLMRCNRPGEALASFDQAIAAKPDADTLNNRGVALQALSRFEDALASFDQAIALAPDQAEAHSNRGGVLAELKRYEEALASCDRALELNARSANAFYNRGLALAGLERPEEAIENYGMALAYDPLIETGRGKRLHAAMKICKWDGLEEELQQILQEVAAGHIATPPYTLLALPSTPRQQQVATELYAKKRMPLAPKPQWPAPRKRGKYRIGYFSSDFYNHATSYLAAGMFELHDKAKFELYAFSFGHPPLDDMKPRLDAAFTKFIDVSDMSDTNVAALARDLGLDIAVDLKGHVFDSRPGIFAHHAAPIQVNYLGYPGTMGMESIQYLIADPIVIPPEHRTFYTEKIVYLPDTYQVNDSKKAASDRIFTRAELDLPGKAFVFCCFNHIYKLTPAVFDIWMRLLHKVPGSVLWLLQDDGPGIANLRTEAEKRGIAGERIIFAKRLGPGDHLARHRNADLFVDTFCYNAHTTATDALRGGLPIVTMLGDTFAARVAASLLTAVGLTDMITRTPQEYEDLALALARNPEKLAAVRERLAQNKATYPLLDTPRFTRNIEAAYLRMMEIYERGGAPEHISV